MTGGFVINLSKSKERIKKKEVVHMSDPDVKTDSNGYLVNPQHWNKKIAENIAHSLGVNGLEATHFELLEILRQHYLSKGSLLPEIVACEKLKLKEDCFHDLFGGYENAWKIAGLPDPGIEARTYMDNEKTSKL